MSLINSMLRDLDARHAAGAQTVMPDAVRSPREPRPVSRLNARMLWPIVALAAVGAVAWQTTGYWLPIIEAYRAPVQPAAKPMPAVPQQPAAPVPPTPIASGAPAATATPALTAPVQAAKAQPEMAAPTAGVPPASQPIGERPDLQGGLKIDSSLLQVPVPKSKPHAAAGAAKAKTISVAKAAAPGNTRVVIDKRQPLAAPNEAAEAEYRKGVAAFKLGHFAEATTQFKSALREDPRHLAARQTLLSILVDQKQWDEAQALLRDGLELMPAQTSWAITLARVQVERGRAADAWDTLQKYMSFGETNADYQGFAAVLLQRLEKPREAAAHYQAALQLKPNDARWWLGLGVALEADGRSDEARKAFQKARGAEGLTPDMIALIEKKLR